MPRIFVLVCLALSVSSAGWAKPKPKADSAPLASRIGDEKPAKTSFKDEGWGLKLSVPKGWELRRGTDGLVMTSQDAAGFVIVFHFEGTSMEELRSGAGEGLIIDGGNMLRVVGSPRDFGKTGVRVRYQGVVGAKTKVVGYAIGVVSKFDTNAIVLGVFPESEGADRAEAMVEKIAKSMKLSAPRGPKKIKNWKKDLSNTRLDAVVFARSSGFGEDGDGLAGSESLILCKDGSLLERRGDSSTLAALAAGQDVGEQAAMKTQRLGTWDVTEDAAPKLVLSFDDGTTRDAPLAYEGKRLDLSSHRYFWSRATCK
ncbi:MAG: hypothetical protein R3E66_03195 [bacterium]